MRWLPVSNFIHRRERLLILLLAGLSLPAIWLSSGHGLLLVTTLFLMLFAIALLRPQKPRAAQSERDALTGLRGKQALVEAAKMALSDCEGTGLHSATFSIALEDLETARRDFGDAVAKEAIRAAALRISSVVRGGDCLARTAQDRFGLVLCAVRHLDLEACIQLSRRLQMALEEPVPLLATSVYLNCSIGFCHSERAPRQTAQAFIKAADDALIESRRTGPSAVRAYSSEVGRRAAKRMVLREDALRAIEMNQIKAWFQPQISTDTGRVTGFEALARWEHPIKGTLPPHEFLDIFQEGGQLPALSRVMLAQSLAALRNWDAARLEVPRVSVNFSASELRNPEIADRIGWDLDRASLAPERLTVEILETVIAGDAEDMITRNVRALSKLGCRIDLDDFGTGHSSMNAIRRFDVSRLKIDRSFVVNADKDDQQRKMVSAVIGMADQLGLETVAEGVETAQEHAILAQLGCKHVQGFAIARPMPFQNTMDWLVQQRARLDLSTTIGQNPPPPKPPTRGKHG